MYFQSSFSMLVQEIMFVCLINRKLSLLSVPFPSTSPSSLPPSLPPLTFLSPPFTPSLLSPSSPRKLDHYCKVYQSVKGLRTLEWKPHLGLVQVSSTLCFWYKQWFAGDIRFVTSGPESQVNPLPPSQLNPWNYTIHFHPPARPTIDWMFMPSFRGILGRGEGYRMYRILIANYWRCSISFQNWLTGST